MSESLTDIPLEAVVEDLLQATGQLLRRLRAEAKTSSDLTWSQTVVLKRLETAGAMTTAELARAEAVTPQSMGVTLAGLEQAGFVTRRTNPANGRQLLYTLTDAGAAVRRRQKLLKRAWLSAAMAELEPQARRTMSEAAAFIKRLSEA